MGSLQFTNSTSYQAGYSIRMTAEPLTDELDRLAINVNETFVIITSKNPEGQKTLEHWVNVEYADDQQTKREKLDKLQVLLERLDLFEIIDNQKQAYLEILRISDKNWRGIFTNFPPSKYPLRPTKSFELLKDWYFQVLQIDKEEFLRSSMDTGLEVLNRFEISKITEMIESIEETKA